MKGLVVCGGIVRDVDMIKEVSLDVDFIICADKGTMYAKMVDIVPDLIVGDMDSILGEDALNYYKEKNVPVETYPTDKDMTDSEIAIWKAVEKGCDELVIMGATKDRLDHCIGNVLVLKKLLDNNVKAVIKDENNEVRLINDKIKLYKDDGYKVSLLPLTQEVRGITTYGLKYALDNGTLVMGKSIGVSNEFDGEVAEITIKEGLLLVIKSKDYE